MRKSGKIDISISALKIGCCGGRHNTCFKEAELWDSCVVDRGFFVIKKV